MLVSLLWSLGAIMLEGERVHRRGLSGREVVTFLMRRGVDVDNVLGPSARNYRNLPMQRSAFIHGGGKKW